MKKEDIIFSKKEFLNLPGQEEMASIMAQVTLQTYWGNKDDLERNVDYTLIISDCNKQIRLDFNHGDEYDQENSLFKLDTLINTLSEFRSVLVNEFKIQNELKIKREEKKKRELEEAKADKEEVSELKKQIEKLKEELDGV